MGLGVRLVLIGAGIFLGALGASAYDHFLNGDKGLFGNRPPVPGISFSDHLQASRGFLIAASLGLLLVLAGSILFGVQ